MSSAEFCLVGLPGTGKTSFLAALWALCGDAGAAAAALTLSNFPADAEYLQQIANPWFAGSPVDRTAVGSDKRIEIDLAGLGGELSLRVPDLSGESFMDAVADRRLANEVAEVLSEADGIIFFVNAATATVPTALADLPPLEVHDDGPAEGGHVADDGGPDEDEGPPEGENPTKDDEPKEFDARKLETDWLHSELVQLIAEFRFDPPRAPIIVVISAWDTVEGLGMEPEPWLRHHQPMLAQVIGELRREIDVEVCAISAQGADYKSKPEIIESPPLERTVFVRGEDRGADLTQVIVWLGQMQGALPDAGTE